MKNLVLLLAEFLWRNMLLTNVFLDIIKRYKTTFTINFIMNNNNDNKNSPSGYCVFNPISANPTNWSNTFKQFVGKSRLIV